MADDEPPRAEPVDELLGGVHRPAHADLVAQLGKGVPAGQRLADVHDGDARPREHRLGLLR
jgi:hypothetical protein